MPRTSGEADTDPCDPRCKRHAGQNVSQRVRIRCTREIERDIREQEAFGHLVPAEPSSAASTSLTSLLPPETPDLANQMMASIQAAYSAHIAYTRSDFDDVTMPTWGLPTRSDDDGNSDLSKSDSDSIGAESLRVHAEHDSGGEGGSVDGRSPTPGSERSWGTRWSDYSPSDDEYTLGSEADIDTDRESLGDLDDAAMRPLSPLLPEPLNLPVAAPEAVAANGLGETGEAENTPESDADEPLGGSDLPDGLRALREWTLKQSSTGDLTVAAADSFLKTLDMCLNKGLLRCGPDINPDHRLPQTLETLQRHADNSSKLLNVYAICPDFGCQTLKAVATMDPKQRYNCERCGKAITRMKVKSRSQGRVHHHHVPILKFTACSVEKQLKEILARPGVLEAIQAHREYLSRQDKAPGISEDIQHGEAWKNLTKGDTKFFTDPNNIGFILMCDWFQPNSRQGAPSYSTGAISLAIANLPPHLRARPENKILVGVIPGPHEPDVDTMHNFLKPMVDELVSLWNDGFIFADSNGKECRAYAALIVCACDAPAARKLGGISGATGTYPCTGCWVSKDELHCFDTEFQRRSRKEHKRAAKAYRQLRNKNQRSEFLRRKYEKGKPGGYRHSALLRLPYWDTASMVIVDPMHCLFLGLVNWQFHTVWIDMKHLRPGEELDKLQEMVRSTLRPRHCGRPPGNLGSSSAGSLTADPLRSLATIDLPLAIPVLWDKVDTNSVAQRAHEEWARRIQLKEQRAAEARKGDKVTRDATKARQRAEARSQSSRPPQKRPRRTDGGSGQRSGAAGESSESDELPADAQVLANAVSSTEADARERGQLSWRKQDAEAILLLASALKFLCARTITEDNITKGEFYLIQYLNMCKELRGAQRIHPNHHFATHFGTQLRRFGPMHQIWTYSGERLNYMLKNTNNNSRGGGEREHTFANVFHRRRQCITRLSIIAADASDQLAEWAAYMLQLDSSDMRGTAAVEISAENSWMTPVQPRRAQPIGLKPWQYDALGDALARLRPDLRFRRAVWQQSDLPVLSDQVYPLRQLVLRGRVFSKLSLGNSIIKARVFEGEQEVERVGEILDLWEHIYRHSSDGTGNVRVINTFALVRWYKASPIFAPRSVRLWTEKFPHLDIEIYVQGQYLDHHSVIPTSAICCHCARMSAILDENPVWLTIGLERE